MNYLEKAKYFGQDVEAIKRGERVISQVTLKSIDDYKLLFSDGLTDDQKSQWLEAFEKREIYDHEDQARNAFFKHVYGGAELSSEAMTYSEMVFPMVTTMDTAENRVIDADLSIGPADSPYGISAGTLTFAGGSITVETTSFTLSAENLVLEQGGESQYHVYILGTAGTDGLPGSNGANGANGANGKDEDSKNSGDECKDNGTHGDNGDDGDEGGDGGDGEKGEANFVASFTIDAFDESNIIPFALYTNSGAGGNGGDGGNGGNGGDGGDGGDGCTSEWEGTKGKGGGDGGDGGDGGNGGNGADALDGVNSLVSFPYDLISTMLLTKGEKALGGTGGTEGQGGDLGAKGMGGDGGKEKFNQKRKDPGNNGSSGVAGDPGDPGVNGKDAETAGQFTT